MELPAKHGSGQRNCFYLTDMTILNAFLAHKSRGGKMTHKVFRDNLVRELIVHSQEGNVTASGTSRGRPSPAADQLIRLEVKNSQHWPSKGKRRCRVFAVDPNKKHFVFLQKV
jgi:hypothetical protein